MATMLTRRSAGARLASSKGCQPALPLRSVVRPSRRSAVVPRAEANKPENSELSNKVASTLGLPPTDEGIFGFIPLSELWVGRWAMIGFMASLVGEFTTGLGSLGQIGLETPSVPLFVAICTIFGGATVVASGFTANKILKKDMSKKEVDRYKNFLGLNKENDWIAESVNMKKRGDFTAPGNDMAAIRAAKAQGSPVDQFLSTNDKAEGEAASREMKAGVLTAEKDEEVVPQAQPSTSPRPSGQSMAIDDMQYAKDVEITNGRWAMIGFLVSILVEAATGKGIILQCIGYLKWANILGPMSGF